MFDSPGEQPKESVMYSQIFSHDNELLSAAPLSADNDYMLFTQQDVSLLGNGKVQWDFILHNGKDVHFREAAKNLPDDASLNSFKHYIRRALKEYLTH
jgi:hypothetical protein|nr:MAG TPA: Vacuolar sorting protein 39 domain 2 [Caudoviricetes sp.]